jgi:O-succinylbenzoic acid--CoA ligase
MPGRANPRDYKTQFLFEGFKASPVELNSLTHRLSGFEQKVVDFALEWISGKVDFEFTTSGSTGKPQKIKFNRTQIQASAQLTQQVFELKAGNHALLCLDTNFIAGKMMVVRALETGMNLVCVSPTSNPLVGLKLNLKIDFAAFVPYQLETILDNTSSSKKLSQIRKAIIGGASVSAELSQKLQSLPTQFYETYGMTETLTHVAIRKLNPPETAFHTLPGVKLFLDERLCLNIKADHISNEVIRSNDLVNMLSDSTFSLIGRYDNLINTAGVKVSPEDVERKMAGIMSRILPQREYFIAGLKDKAFGEKVALFIETVALPDAKHEVLTAEFRALLKKWEVPKEIICMPSFKRTGSGKVNRKETIPSAFVP